MKLKAQICLDESILCALKQGKNLLGFSYGSDSSALFYLLKELNISFDLAMIDYEMRAASKAEVATAQALAKKFNKQIFTQKAPQFKSNFESNARAFRYAFFEQIMQEKGFNTLILAHQLNDLFEWFLMQFSKGAGIYELLGMKSLEKRVFKTPLNLDENSKSYTLARPLLNTSKAEILEFLKQNEIFYFKDESNDDEKFWRNFFRKHFSDEFLKHFSKGVQKSFEYLRKDLKSFASDEIKEFKGILICAINESVISKAFKQKGIVLSAAQRALMLEKDCVISSKIALCFYQNKALIFEYIKTSKMPKIFKDECRREKLPPFLRMYLYAKNISLAEFKSFFNAL